MNAFLQFISRPVRRLIKRVIGYESAPTLDELIDRGLKIGKGASLQPGWIFDPSHCWLISIGDNVTMAPRVYILAHDASTQRALGYTKIGRVRIGNNVFIGANSMILPGVTIGDGVVVGANSLVSKSVEPGMVVGGNPARVICTTEAYLEKERLRLQRRPRYDLSYTLQGGITEQQKLQMLEELADGIGFIV